MLIKALITEYRQLKDVDALVLIRLILEIPIQQSKSLSTGLFYTWKSCVENAMSCRRHDTKELGIKEGPSEL